MRRLVIIAILLLLIIPARQLKAQYFSGVKGSIYSPVINTSSQPAAGAGMPLNWGIQIAGFNSFWSNNIVALSPARIDWQQDSIDLRSHLITGSGKRKGTANADIHILNFLFRIPGHKKWVVGAGWNIRSRSFANNMDYDYQDTMTSITQFLEVNAINNQQHGQVINQQWMEWFITASTILRENEFEKLAVGGNLKLIKGISAEVIDIDNLQLTTRSKESREYSAIAQIAGRYGYSANLEDLDNNQSSREQIQTLTNGSPVSLGLDIGLSYTRKKPVFVAGFTNNDLADYKWKISLSLTDFGRLKYPLGKESRMMNGIKNIANLDDLQNSLDKASSLAAFNDTLNRIVNIAPWEGAFSVSLPTALQIGFDKNMGRHFYVHANLVLDASFLNPGLDYQLHTINYLTITPRWEIKHFGAYIPLYLNDRGTFLAGAAVRLGPLTAGVHDFGWLFDHTRSGGGYIALTIKNFIKGREECFSF